MAAAKRLAVVGAILVALLGAVVLAPIAWTAIQDLYGDEGVPAIPIGVVIVLGVAALRKAVSRDRPGSRTPAAARRPPVRHRNKTVTVSVPRLS